MFSYIEFWLDPCLSSTTTCFHHGTCTSSPALSLSSSSSQPYKCVCTEAYTGSRCEMELPCPFQRCLHNGTCQRNAQFGYFECLCTSNYLGSSCERGFFSEKIKNRFLLFYNLSFYLAIRITAPPSPCGILPCFNGGTCSVTSVGGFACVCLPKFTGQRCEDLVTTMMTTTTASSHPPPPPPPLPLTTTGQIVRQTDACQNNPCLNAGSCILNGVGGFICQCLNGFVGNRCEARGKYKFILLKWK
jgi:Notch-like protein